MLLFLKKKFDNYWFETATPTFLLDLIRTYRHDVSDIEGMRLSNEDFASYEVESMPLMPLLYNTGYITIGNVTRQPDLSYKYEMRYPNYEVRNSFFRSIISYFIGQQQSVNPYLEKLLQALATGNMPQFIAVLQTVFASIPYEIDPTEEHIRKGANYEAHYHSVLYAMLKVTGMQVSAEERTNRGRIDLVIETANAIYIFEMKVNKPAKDAILQIREKGYADKYRMEGKRLILVGLSFSRQDRNITEFAVEEG